MSGKKRICGNDNHKKVLFSCIVQDKNVFYMFKDCWLKLYTQESWWLPIPVIESAVKSDEQRAARGKRFLSAFTSDQILSLKSLPTLLRRGATTDLMLFYSIHAIYYLCTCYIWWRRWGAAGPGWEVTAARVWWSPEREEEARGGVMLCTQAQYRLCAVVSTCVASSRRCFLLCSCCYNYCHDVL